ncbi:hypothetical protein BU25DRAFT_448834 [Macroventuria anomochaeta]|uniref:Uncharacterized protein n=1 Tax=Macroventuria anomochaeta TaxID=301207 RepID=A0ACB6RYS0_9PLEO|nr:uncharacterized protein BU25DRAFT_448834 [Macroventuria anomochaeta]KAF2627056.1 hypothetical protein BU25DRAFT_448834 [Macroventuria anomochaeta]
MSAYEDPTIAKPEAQINKINAKVDARLSNASKLITKIQGCHRDNEKHFKKAEILLAEHKVAIIAPHILLAAQILPDTKLKLEVAEYEIKRQSDECKRLEAKHLDARKSEIRVKKENKQLTKIVESLTAQFEGKATPEEKCIKTENEKLMKKLAMLSAQLKSKIEECEIKDQAFNDLREEFAAYLSVNSDTWSHRHDSCNELVAALEEQCGMFAAERDALEANLNTLYHKNNFLTIERDNLQGRFDVNQHAFQIPCRHQLT